MNPLESLIHAKIGEKGPMSFARFMELALYHSQWGYYARDEAMRNVGRKGDFFTSVSVGPLFGKLLACQFVKWWEALSRPSPFQLVEFGGLDGQLALDILAALERESPECSRAVEYFLVEPLPRLEQCQRKKLAGRKRVRWVDSIHRLMRIEGVAFANEVLDALPAHLLEHVTGAAEKDAASWLEWRVVVKNGSLGWVRRPCPVSLHAQLPRNARGRVEICPRAPQWLEEIAGLMKKGYLLFLDYGMTDEEHFQIERPAGTLRAYRQHGLVEDVLKNPGEQDITAHVRWTPLLDAAARLNLDVEEFIQQSRWLSRIVAQGQVAMDSGEIRQFHTLAHPEMMGASFRALVLRKKGPMI